MKVYTINKDAKVYVNPYNWDNETLVRKLTQACVRVGANGVCGLQADFRTLYKHPEALYAFYLKGVVLARLKRQKPPFQPGDSVITAHGHRAWPLNGLIFGLLPPGETVKIVRVHCDGNNVWRVEVKGHPGLLYRAEDFSLVPPIDNSPLDGNNAA